MIVDEHVQVAPKRVAVVADRECANRLRAGAAAMDSSLVTYIACLVQQLISPVGGLGNALKVDQAKHPVKTDVRDRPGLQNGGSLNGF